MTDDLEVLFQTYFQMSDRAKESVQKVLLLRLIEVKNEWNELHIEEGEEVYTIEEVLHIAENEYVLRGKFEMAGIVKDIKSKLDNYDVA